MTIQRPIIADDIYDQQVRIALSETSDWNAQLRAAQILAGSPDWTHANLARHLREAHALHMHGLLRANIDPQGRRARSDMVDGWKAQAARPRPSLRLDDVALIGGALFAVGMIALVFAKAWGWV